MQYKDLNRGEQHVFNIVDKLLNDMLLKDNIIRVIKVFNLKYGGLKK